MLDLEQNSLETMEPALRPVIGVYVRNSTRKQCGNPRSEWQMDLVSYVERIGFECRLYDEWGVSGATLERRPRANTMLGDLQAGTIQGIAVAELSRLTRDFRGIDASFIGYLLKTHAEGRLITFGKVFDLRRNDDWQLYQVLSRFAGFQRAAIREMMYAGYVKSAERQPVFKGKVKVGYQRVETGNDRAPRSHAKTTLAKDNAQAAVMFALAREFERQRTLSDVVRALHAAGIRRPNSKGPAVAHGLWESRELMAILLDPVYMGEWRLLGRFTSSDVWAQLTREGFDPAEIHHSVPHLAWFTAAEMARWRKKLLVSLPTTSRRPHHAHRLAGVLVCPECDRPFFRGAATDTAGIMYRCNGVERGHSSRRQRSLSERTALRSLRAVLPRILPNTWHLLAAAAEGLPDQAIASLHAQLRACDKRATFVRESWLAYGEAELETVDRELERLDIARVRLQQAAQEAEQQAELRTRTARALRSHENPLETFDSLTEDEQAAVWRVLVRNVKITVTRARGKNFTAWVHQWAPADNPHAIQCPIHIG